MATSSTSVVVVDNLDLLRAEFRPDKQIRDLGTCGSQYHDVTAPVLRQSTILIRRGLIHGRHRLVLMRRRLSHCLPHHPSRHIPNPTIRPPRQADATPGHSGASSGDNTPRPSLRGLAAAAAQLASWRSRRASHQSRGRHHRERDPGGRTIKSSPSAPPLLLPDDPACADFDQVLVY